MRLLQTIFLISLLTLTSCSIKESLDACEPPINAELLFKYLPDATTIDQFSKNIKGVDMFIFDASDKLVQSQKLTDEDLQLFQGARLSLDPGTYRVVCWGNVFSRTTLTPPSPAQSLADGNLFNNTVASANSVGISNDSLYYAPIGAGASTYRLVVPESGLISDVIYFTSAHIHINVFVRGLLDPNGTGGHHQPKIELTNIVPRYDFLMNTYGSVASYIQPTTEEVIKDKTYSSSYFFTTRFLDDNPINVNVLKGSNNQNAATVNLKQFMIDHRLSVLDRDDVTICILFEFLDGTIDGRIRITIPDWIGVPVTPEM